MNELSRSRRIGVLVTCCLSLFMVGLDVTVVNVALPSIGQDLATGISGLQWTVDSYTVVMASLLMLSGSTGDRFGRKRMFVLGLALFSAASLACSLAPSVGLLVLFRVLQAVGGATLNPVAVSVIANTFTDPRERAQALGVRGAIFGISLALGPIVGGSVVAAAGWRPIFLLNVPVGLATIVLAFLFIPESKAARPRRFDPIGQLAVIILLGALTYAIIEAPVRGWSSTPIIAAFAASAAALGTLLLYESRRHEPLIDLRFFRSIPFASASVVSVAAFAAFGGFLFLSTLYLQQSRGLSPIETGLAIMPMAIMTAIASAISGRIVGRRGPRLPLVVSGIGALVGCALLTGIDSTTSFTWLVAAYAIFGIGFGFVNAPVTDAALSGMPRAQAGVASAIASTSRQVGLALGVAIAGAIITSRAGESVREDPSAATHAAWWTLTFCGVIVLMLGLFATTMRADASARRVAAELNPEALGA